MKLAAQIALAKATKHVHRTWYLNTYPDVASLRIDPAVHYLRYGAGMGRNPGKNFDTRYYLEAYPDAAESGLNPLIHYALHGQAKGYSTRRSQKTSGMRQIGTIRARLLTLGFTERPLQEFEAVMRDDPDPEARGAAAAELGLWHMRTKTQDGYRKAVEYLTAAHAAATSLDARRKFATAELLCHHFLGDTDAAYACYERAALAGEAGPDLVLAAANLEPTVEGRLAQINRLLTQTGIPAIRLSDAAGLSPYDRLTSATSLPKVNGGPKVTVLIAAYEAADTLPTALRSLQEQTWQNLEILVLDDCSPGGETVRIAQQFADRDPRIRVIRMEKNGGAYIARNRGLDEATGTYVTLHDADDWSHPLKIETQVRFMEANPEVMGCTSQQARTTPSLNFPRWAGAAASVGICRHNMSSFMARHHPVFEKVGYWDAVRFGADSEKIQRVRSAFGRENVVFLETGILSLQRISETSIASDDSFGYEGFFFGARREYLLGQQAHREKEIRYTTPDRPNFGVPRVMHPERAQQDTHFDVIIASEYRMKGGSTRSNIEEIVCQARAGMRTGIVQMYRYEYPDKGILPEVRELIDSGQCTLITHGEKVSCDLLTVRYPPVLDNIHRYLPKIDAKCINVVVNQPPMSDYGPEGVRRYHLDNCAKNTRHHFGKDATWYPIGPLVREALQDHHAAELHHIDLAPDDWSNIIDVAEWDRGPHELTKTLRIGRHSRDHDHKWPTDAADILAAYPDAADVEVHVLGGAKIATAALGAVPDNWIVHGFGTVHPRDFLKDVDVWVYFANPGWVESFGRTIIEAMAVGVPVILPEVYRPLFKDAALYATAQTSLDMARKLHADPETYQAQVKTAQDYVRDHFGYEMHVRRVREAAKVATAAIADVAPEAPPKTALEAPPRIPMKSGKTPYSELLDLPKISFDEDAALPMDTAALLNTEVRGHRFDYLWSPKPGSDRLFVIFSGDVKRSKISPPVFQRWKWARHFPGHCLYVSDPMLHMHPELGLAWYAGTADFDPMVEIIRRAHGLLPSLSLQPKDVCAYGSSGGGFAALRMASLWKNISAVSINPQTNITKFKWSSPDFYAQICLDRKDRRAALADYPMRMDLTRHASELSERNLILIQNTLDVHHYEHHYKPLCAALGASSDANPDRGRFRRILFANEGGHSAAETPEVFAQSIQILKSRFH